MVISAALLIRESGVDGTSFAKVLKHSNSPRGSIGHHFPGGKTEMVRDAIIWAGDAATSLMREAADRGDSARQIFDSVTGFYRDALVDSGYSAGCPIGVTAQEHHQDDELRNAVRTVFDSWRTILTDTLRAEGKSKQESEDLAQLAVASVEGALLMARVDRSPDPVDAIIRQVSPLLGTESQG